MVKNMHSAALTRLKPRLRLQTLRNELRYQTLRRLPVEDLCNIGQHRLGFIDHVVRLSPADMRGPQNVLEVKQRRIRRHRLVPVNVQSGTAQMPAFEAFVPVSYTHLTLPTNREV